MAETLNCPITKKPCDEYTASQVLKRTVTSVFASSVPSEATELSQAFEKYYDGEVSASQEHCTRRRCGLAVMGPALGAAALALNFTASEVINKTRTS